MTPETEAEIEKLLSQRQGKNMTDPKLYSRLSARIRYLRDPSAVRKSINAWRQKNRGEIRYNRGLRCYPKKKMSAEARAKANERARAAVGKNPQRLIRQRIERALHLVYGTMASDDAKTSCGKHRRGRKAYRTPYLLGCSLEEFRLHIKSQLDRLGLRWKDWRITWTMDHIVPVRKFDLPREECACWHYTNLRPLAKGLNSNRGWRAHQ